MMRERLYQGMWAGLIATAATLGVLIGFGRAHGAAFQPLNMVAHVAYGTRAMMLDEFNAAVTITGLLILAAAMVIWGVVFALLAGRFRGLPLVVAATLVTAIAWVFNHFILPSRVAPGLDHLLTRGETIALYVVMAIALAIGAGLAALPGRAPAPWPDSNDRKSDATADVVHS